MHSVELGYLFMIGRTCIHTYMCSVKIDALGSLTAPIKDDGVGNG